MWLEDLMKRMEDVAITDSFEDTLSDEVPDLDQILADKYCKRILEATSSSPRSVIDLSTSYGIPLTTAYRRVRKMVKQNVLKSTGAITDDGRKVFLYQSKAVLEKLSSYDTK